MLLLQFFHTGMEKKSVLGDLFFLKFATPTMKIKLQNISNSNSHDVILVLFMLDVV